jgi:uncharacterized membrane protein YoaK (UPF0700 family)
MTISKLWPFVALFVILAAWAFAQTPRTPPREAAGYLVVAVCGTLPAPAYVAGSYAAPTVDVTGQTCVNK